MARPVIMPGALAAGPLQGPPRATIPFGIAFLAQLDAHARLLAIQTQVITKGRIGLTRSPYSRTIATPFVAKFADALPCAALAVIDT